MLTQIIIWILGIYLALSLIIYFFQHYFFFRPEILSRSFDFNYPFEFEEYDFDMEDGGSVNGILFRVPNSRGVVYYFKGNSRSIKGWGKFAKDFISNGFDFFIMDYRGFGKSRGKRTEAKLYNDSQQIYRWLNKTYPEDQIIIYGRSLGSGIAARIASWNDPAILILDSPYYSFLNNIKRYVPFLPLKWILRYSMRTNLFLKKVNSPIHIIHGTKDRLIPIKHSKKLKSEFPKKVILHEIEGAKHNNLPDFPEYYELLYDLLNDISNKNLDKAA